TASCGIFHSARRDRTVQRNLDSSDGSEINWAGGSAVEVVDRFAAVVVVSLIGEPALLKQNIRFTGIVADGEFKKVFACAVAQLDDVHSRHPIRWDIHAGRSGPIGATDKSGIQVVAAFWLHFAGNFLQRRNQPPA